MPPRTAAVRRHRAAGDQLHHVGGECLLLDPTQRGLDRPASLRFGERLRQVAAAVGEAEIGQRRERPVQVGERPGTLAPVERGARDALPVDRVDVAVIGRVLRLADQKVVGVALLTRGVELGEPVGGASALDLLQRRDGRPAPL